MACFNTFEISCCELAKTRSADSLGQRWLLNSVQPCMLHIATVVRHCKVAIAKVGRFLMWSQVMTPLRVTQAMKNRLMNNAVHSDY